jgi:gamma-glutamyl:cysteine ligase YbdK (ATP-grasp superfamily)
MPRPVGIASLSCVSDAIGMKVTKSACGDCRQIGDCMTTLLQRAVAEAEKLPAEDQDAIASRLLAEVEDERQWANRFAATTDDQWDRLVAEVRRDVAAGGTHPLDEIFPPDGRPR